MPVVSGTAYATRADLANLGLIGGALVNVSTATQDAVLLAASAIADSYLQSAFVLPITAWGQDLVRAVCTIAAYDLLTSRGFGMVQGPDENIRKRYEDALSWLQEASEGGQSPAYIVDSSIGNSGATGSSGSTDGSVVTTSQGGLQMVTSPVRGWTGRGKTSGGIGDPWSNL
jgi:phage gp36-like protein